MALDTILSQMMVLRHAIIVGGMGRESNLVIDFRQTDLTPTTRIKGEVNKQGWRKMTPREMGYITGVS